MLVAADQDVEAIRELDDFFRLCKTSDKETIFVQHNFAALVPTRDATTIRSVVTSSGHGGKFAYGMTDQMEYRNALKMTELGLSLHFDVDRQSTMLINCLAMGVRINATNVTIADIGPREDMAMAIVEFFGTQYQQLIFVGDPLFLKRLGDLALASDYNWRRKKTHIIVGGETFGEAFRDYLCSCFAIDKLDQGSIRSSLGVAELGLNLMFETAETVELRRRANKDAAFSIALFGQDYTGRAPMLFAYNPLRAYLEVIDRNKHNIGRLAVSILTKCPLPLFRYLTGDRVKLISENFPEGVYLKSGARLEQKLKFPLVAFFGRETDQIDEDASVLDFKDALFQDPYLARDLSGAIRLNRDCGKFHIDIQLAENRVLSTNGIEKLTDNLPGKPTGDQIKIWPYAEFPYGHTLDYQRKFSYLGKSVDA
jgi:phenylacetate-CoA ligase